LPSALFDFSGCFLDMLLAARGGDDIGFGVCEAEAEDTPDPGGASNYNGGFCLRG